MTPRGVRNFNPGNLRFDPTNRWQGRATMDQRSLNQLREREFEVFVSPEYGIRAMAVLLTNYYDRYGINTLDGIIPRYAPSNENNTEAYIRSVAVATGFQPGQPLDLHDYATMKSLVVAIIRHENGQQPYSDAVIDLGLAMAGFKRPPKPLTQSRTLAGGAIAATSSAGSMALEAAQSVEEVRSALLPIADMLDWMQYALAALAIVGAGLAIYARIRDNARRV